MPDLAILSGVFGSITIGLPVALVAVLTLPGLFNIKLTEATTVRAVQWTTALGLVASIAMLLLMIVGDSRHITTEFGDWIHLDNPAPEAEYHFSIKFIFDRLSIPFLLLIYVLVGTIGAFSAKYLHREPGFHRYFVLYALFLAGMVITALAATIETLFLGWELVGLSSAFLVGFFQDRPSPVRNALRVWCVYRVSDAALLLAAVWLHHLSGGGDFDKIMGYLTLPGIAPIDQPSWPFGASGITGSHAIIVGLLMLIAAAGKSAMIPFSGWLPRAMEGPTPSSAVFYGALSVHLGAYLLLRLDPMLEASPFLSVLVLVLGLITALFASLAARVQTDVKSALAFAALTQVGLIFAEIGLGWRYIPLVHLLGHACLRTLQFLRAPSFIRDHHAIENALGQRRVSQSATPRGRWSEAIYRFAFERGSLDAMLDRFVVAPTRRFFETIDRMDRWATALLKGDWKSAATPAPAPEPAERTT